MSSTNNGVDLESVHDVYQSLYNSLNNAFAAEANLEKKARIHGVMAVVFDTLTALNLAALEVNSVAFTELGAKVKATNDQLAVLKAASDKLSATFTNAMQVATAIDQAIDLAAKFFTL